MINFKNKKGLGRGLSSLIGEGTVSSNTKASISDLTRNKYQPRKKFDETSFPARLKRKQEIILKKKFTKMLYQEMLDYLKHLHTVCLLYFMIKLVQAASHILILQRSF